MSSIEDAIRKLIEERRRLERTWDSTDGTWKDSRRDEVERSVVQPLVRSASDLTREMEAIAAIVRRALAAL